FQAEDGIRDLHVTGVQTCALPIFPTEKIIERLRYENPWWITKEIPNTYSSMSKRLYFDLFYPFVLERSIKRALVLMGPRRVGKRSEERRVGKENRSQCAP